MGPFMGPFMGPIMGLLIGLFMGLFLGLSWSCGRGQGEADNRAMEVLSYPSGAEEALDGRAKGPGKAGDHDDGDVGAPFNGADMVVVAGNAFGQLGLGKSTGEPALANGGAEAAEGFRTFVFAHRVSKTEFGRFEHTVDYAFVCAVLRRHFQLEESRNE